MATFPTGHDDNVGQGEAPGPQATPLSLLLHSRGHSSSTPLQISERDSLAAGTHPVERASAMSARLQERQSDGELSRWVRAFTGKA